MLTLEDYLQTNPSPVETLANKQGLLLYRCPGCGNYRGANLIVDVRALVIPEEWACDGCWTHWQRIGRKIDNIGHDPEDRRAWIIRWAVAHGEPTSVIQGLSLLRKPDKYIKEK